MFKDFYYKKYLKYKNKYINLQSQLGGRTNPVSLNDLPDAISSENDDISVPLRPFRQNATSGRPVDVSLGALPDAISSENDDISVPFRQNATSGRPVDVSSIPPLVPPQLGRQNVTSGVRARVPSVPSVSSIDPPPLVRQHAVDISSGHLPDANGSENNYNAFVPLSPSRQNGTSRVRARVPSVSSIGPPPLVRQYAVDISSSHLPDAISSENNYIASVSIASVSVASVPASGDPVASVPASGDPVASVPASRYSHIVEVD